MTNFTKLSFVKQNLIVFGISCFIFIVITLPGIYFLLLKVIEYCDESSCMILSIQYGFIVIPLCVIVAILLLRGNFVRDSITGLLIFVIFLLIMYIFREQLFYLSRKCSNSTMPEYISPSGNYELCGIQKTDKIVILLSDRKTGKKEFITTNILSNSQSLVLMNWSNDDKTVNFKLDPIDIPDDRTLKTAPEGPYIFSLANNKVTLSTENNK